jgi:hypothetical protein
MHPSARSMSANMSRIAAGRVARKNSSSGKGNLFVTRCVLCVLCVSFYCCTPEAFSVGARKDFVISTSSERSYLQGNTDKILEGAELTVGVDVTAPGLGVDAAAGSRALVAGLGDLGRARGSAGCRGGVVWGCGRVVGATRGGLVVRRWCVHAW